MAGFERALLVAHTTAERARERKQLLKATRARKKQATGKSIASFIGKAVGLTLGIGPAGLFLGNIASGLYDYLNKAERKTVDIGKFDIAEGREIRRSLSEYDREETLADIINIGTTGLQAFGLGGGFEALAGKEGAGAILNKEYWTQFKGGGRGLLSDYLASRKPLTRFRGPG